MAALATIVAIIILWGVFSRPLDRRGITSAMVFLGAGLLVGSSVLGWLDVSVESTAAELVTEVALALLLFSDAAPARPAGAASRAHVADAPAPHRPAPDDAGGDGHRLAGVSRHGARLRVPALDNALLHRRRARPEGRHRRLGAGPRPPGARRGDGLNDGLAVPVLPGRSRPRQRRAHDRDHVGRGQQRRRSDRLGARGRSRRGPGWRAALPRRGQARLDRQRVAPDRAARGRAARLRLGGHARRQRLHRRLRRRHGLRHRLRCARLRRDALHGRDRRPAGRRNLDRIWRPRARRWSSPTSPGRSSCTRCSASRWCAWCRSRSHCSARASSRPTMAFIGWFGPRGLASVVFALLVLERGVPEGQTLLTTVVVTVALSVVLHGLTSVPFVRRLSPLVRRACGGAPDASEAQAVTVPRQRRHLSAGDLKRLREGAPR